MNGIVIGLLIPFLGLVLGSAFVFFMKNDMPMLLQKMLLGFASGVMVAASVWSLLIPSMEMGEGKKAVVPAVAGFLAGMAFLLLIDYITPHLHLGDEHPEGPRSKLSRTAMLSLAVTIHTYRNDLLSPHGSDHMVFLYDHLTVLVINALAGKPSHYTVVKVLNFFIVMHELLDYHARDFLA